MNIGIELIANNLGMSVQVVLLIVMLVGGLIFYAKSFLTGITMQFFMSGLLFLMLKAMQFPYTYVLTVCFVTFAIMALSLVFILKGSYSSGGAFI